MHSDSLSGIYQYGRLPKSLQIGALKSPVLSLLCLDPALILHRRVSNTEGPLSGIILHEENEELIV